MERSKFFELSGISVVIMDNYESVHIEIHFGQLLTCFWLISRLKVKIVYVDSSWHCKHGKGPLSLVYEDLHSLDKLELLITDTVVLGFSVGSVQFSFISDSNPTGNLYLYLCEDAFSCYSWTEKWVYSSCLLCYIVHWDKHRKSGLKHVQ